MKAAYYISVLFLVLMLSCNDKTDKNEDDVAQKVDKEQLISAKAIENFNYTDYALSAEAEAALKNWEKYQELAIQIEYLKKADLSFFSGDKKLIDNFIEELKLEIPFELKTNPIESRIIIMETKMLKLYDNLTLDNIDMKVKLESIKETLQAFSNLNNQINKKLEFDTYIKIQPE